MMLLDIKALLEQRGRISLYDLAVHFHTDPKALEPMLEELCRNGVARRVDSDKPGSCSKCSGCSQAFKGMMCIYEAVEKE